MYTVWLLFHQVYYLFIKVQPPWIKSQREHITISYQRFHGFHTDP